MISLTSHVTRLLHLLFPSHNFVSFNLRVSHLHLHHFPHFNTVQVRGKVSFVFYRTLIAILRRWLCFSRTVLTFWMFALLNLLSSFIQRILSSRERQQGWELPLESSLAAMNVNQFLIKMSEAFFVCINQQWKSAHTTLSWSM